MSALKNKTTSELKVMQERIQMELGQRKSEKEVPILRMIGEDVEDFTPQMLDMASEQNYILNAMKRALVDKNRVFNLKIVMVPESDFKIL
jgi:hypothetical protein